jgi:hypothetical protein
VDIFLSGLRLQVSTLQTQAKIEPGFTQLVWQKLEEQVRKSCGGMLARTRMPSRTGAALKLAFCVLL